MYKTLHGLVLREVKYKESSKILTILTEEEGKITAEARGALRKGSKCSAASQVLTWSDLTFFENRGRYTLTEGSVLEDFAALRADLGDYALGCYMAELLEAVSDEDSHSTALLHLGLNALFALSRQLYPAKHIKAVFELRLMCLAGFAPQLDRCTDCGSHTPEKPRLSLYGGGVHCTGCAPARRESRCCSAVRRSLPCVTCARRGRRRSFPLRWTRRRMSASARPARNTPSRSSTAASVRSITGTRCKIGER